MTHILQSLPNPAVWPYIDQSVSWTGSNVAPHSPTVRISWTTPQGPPTRLHLLYHRRAVATSPTAYADSGIQLIVGGTHYLTVSSILSPTLLVQHFLHTDVLHLPANTLIEVLSYDLSTGGTLFWRIAVQSLRVFP